MSLRKGVETRVIPVVWFCLFSYSYCINSQGSLKVDIFDILNTFLKDIDLEPLSFLHLLWQTYTVKAKQTYFKGMQVHLYYFKKM